MKPLKDPALVWVDLKRAKFFCLYYNEFTIYSNSDYKHNYQLDQIC